MADYYVKTDGDDEADGLSWPNAWATLSKAATTAVAGDTVTFADGTYSVGGGQATWNDGSDGNVITFQALNEGQAVWKKSAHDGAVVDLSNVDYVTTDGFVIDGDYTASSWNGWRLVELDNSTYISILNCTIQDARAHGILILGDCTEILIEDTEVNPNQYIDGGTRDGILLQNSGTSNVTIRGCTVHNTDHVGVSVNCCDGFLIEDTTIHTTHSHCLQFGTPGAGSGNTIDNCVADRCTIYASEGFGPDEPGQHHEGIFVAGGDVDSVTIQRCTIYDTDGSCIQLSNQVVGPITVINNTMHNPNSQGHGDMACIHMWSDSTSPTVTLKNNIFYSTRAAGYTVHISGNYNANLAADYNLYFAGAGANNDVRRGGVTYATYAAYQAVYESNSVIDDDPDFTDLGNDDYTLQAASPAVDAGTNVGLPFQGAGPDIGAHERSAGGVPEVVIIVVVVVAMV